MAEHSSQPSPTQNYTISSFFGSPKFRPFTTKGLCGTEAVLSPTSILDSKPFSAFGKHFQYDRNQPKSPKKLFENKHSWNKIDSKGIGLALALVGTLNDDVTIEEISSKKPSNKTVLFGSKLKVQIPTLSPTESLKSPADFGIKTRNSQVPAFGFANSGSQTKDSPGICTGYLSVKEMELCEDYTCVISHGPNARTTRIFDNCIVESYCSLPEKNIRLENFLSFCYTCKKSLEQTKDIYIYRGDKAFCTSECRYQEMVFDGVENSDFDDAFRTCS